MRDKGKKLTHEHRIRFSMWNIYAVTSRLAKLVDIMIRRRANILLVQKTEEVRKTET